MLSSLLPQIGSFGMYAYWLIFLFAFFEAVPIVCIFIPGLFAIIFGGVFVQQGVLKLADVFWFAVLGNFFGACLTYFFGDTISKRRDFVLRPILSHMAMSLRKYHGPSLILGNFLGPVSGFFPFVVALSKMPHHSFLLWSLPASILSRSVLIAFGYYFSHIVTKLAILSNTISYITFALILIFFVLWWVIISIKYFWPTLQHFAGELVVNLLQRQWLQDWRNAHPKVMCFLANRLHWRDFNGLALSLFGMLFFYFVMLAIDSGVDLFHSSFLLNLDERLSLLMRANWNTVYLDFFSLIDCLSKRKTILLFVSAAVVYLIARNRYGFAAGLLAAVIGNTLTVSLINALVDRPRPYGSYITQASSSFPCGPAGISVVFFGTLAYMLWRTRRLSLVWGIGLAVSLTVLIGFSQVYLLAHYLSDVLNGWLLGAIWMCIGIVLGERWMLQSHPQPERSLRWMTGVSAALLGYGIFSIVNYDPPQLSIALQPQYQPISNIAEIFEAKHLPVTSESITGTPFEPINIIIKARNKTELIRLFRENGWNLARPVGFRSLSSAALSAWTDSPDKTAPITPYFWNTKPNDFGFQMPTKEETLAKRHHIRVWDSGFILPSNNHVYLGAASFDIGLQWGVLHRIDADLDKERKFVAHSLASGIYANQYSLHLTQPRMGTNIAGNKWLTDGKAVVIQSLL